MIIQKGNDMLIISRYFKLKRKFRGKNVEICFWKIKSELFLERIKKKRMSGNGDNEVV